MKTLLNRRRFLSASGAAGLATTAAALGSAVAAEKAKQDNPLKILGVSCSPRRGMTTAKAVQAVLDAAKAANPSVQVELLDLGGLDVAGWRGKDQPEDDFTPLLPKFRDAALGGLIIGSPCYFRSMSSLTKCFLERLAPLRKPEMVLADKPVGVVSVGGFRNGGQELTIQQIHSVLLCYGMLPVGGHSPAFQGATLNSENDSIAEDQLGLETATQLGKRIAELALLRTSSAKNTDR